MHTSVLVNLFRKELYNFPLKHCNFLKGAYCKEQLFYFVLQPQNHSLWEKNKVGREKLLITDI